MAGSVIEELEPYLAAKNPSQSIEAYLAETLEKTFPGRFPGFEVYEPSPTAQVTIGARVIINLPAAPALEEGERKEKAVSLCNILNCRKKELYST